jgi:hypothetical protein
MPVRELVDNKQSSISDLMVFSSILQDNGICPDTSPIQSAINFCHTKGTDDFWYHEISNLLINSGYIYAPGGTIPEAKNIKNISISLSLDAKGHYFNNNKNIVNPLIPISPKNPYSCNIEIQAINQKNQQPLYAAWHFDKDLDKKGNKSDKFIHPHYHWTFGGERLENKQVEGNTLIFPAPRISHPPFDIILAVDYIIKHYLHKDYVDCLLEDTRYINIVKRSQLRLWKPFAIVFASHWVNMDDYSIDKEFYPKFIFPELA